MKIRPLAAELFHTDRDSHDEGTRTVALVLRTASYRQYSDTWGYSH